MEKLEKDIQAEIVRKLKKRAQSFTWKNHSTYYSRAGIPDVMHIEQGILFAIEVKRPGKKATPLQQITLDKLNAYGAISLVAYDWQMVEDVINSTIMIKSNENINN